MPVTRLPSWCSYKLHLWLDPERSKLGHQPSRPRCLHIRSSRLRGRRSGERTAIGEERIERSRFGLPLESEASEMPVLRRPRAWYQQLASAYEALSEACRQEEEHDLQRSGQAVTANFVGVRCVGVVRGYDLDRKIERWITTVEAPGGAVLSLPPVASYRQPALHTECLLPIRSRL